MLGRACVATAIVVAFLVAPMSGLPTAEAASPFNNPLRVYDYQGITLQQRALVLGAGEAFARYYFVLESEPMLPEQKASAGFVEVKRLGTDDVICRGPVADLDVPVHKACHDLIVGHSYVVTYVMTTPARIVLYGNDPVG